MKPTDKEKTIEQASSSLMGMRLDLERAKKIPFPAKQDFECLSRIFLRQMF